MHGTKRLAAALMLSALACPAAAASCIRYDAQGDFLGWADYPHCLVDQHTQSTVRWLDDWFSLPPAESPVPGSASTIAQARLRLVNEWLLDADGHLVPAIRLRASVTLPQLTRRLSLVFEDDTTPVRRDIGLPAVNEAALALRWAALNLRRLQIDTDVGLHSATDLFVRARLRQSVSLGEHDEFRALHSLRYGLQDRWRAIQSLELAHAFGEQRIGVIYHQFDDQPSANGLHWSRGALVAQAVSPTQTLSWGASQEGLTEPGWHLRSASLWLRWRQRVARDWCFIEIEPRLTRSRIGSEDTRPSLALRFEVLWGGEAMPSAFQRTMVIQDPDAEMSQTP